MTSGSGVTPFDLLRSIEAACARCARVTQRFSLETLQADEVEQLALSKAIEQIGEHCNRLLQKFPVFSGSYPELNLNYPVRMRHRIAHGYDDLDYPTLWVIATTSVPELHAAIRRILTDAGEDLT
ncbi:DUF86 domain-containing protein [Jiella endophytica]|uniref:DUF86 domain-containing protein n=1 Tax=Jiella endophytica TaxID=2558362 RepID=A0A4Y8RVA7_9HYPH|nr:HepT-like ribonuclease domain-containing protein [Jiella endophytica]TFF27798.1 DUF86 domain-containing protein [Jiella endophytica]